MKSPEQVRSEFEAWAVPLGFVLKAEWATQMEEEEQTDAAWLAWQEQERRIEETTRANSTEGS